MKRLITALAIFTAIFASCENSSAQTPDTIVPIKLFLGGVKAGWGIDSVSEYSVSASLGLASEFVGKIACANIIARDSIISEIKKRGEVPNAIAIKKALSADYAVFVTVSRLADLLRLDLELRFGNNLSEKIVSHGYEIIRYKNISDDERLLDPPIYRALCRALAVALKDSSMFAALPAKFAVKPTALLAVSGFEYIDNHERNHTRQVFSDKLEGSYFICEKTAETASKSQDYTVVGTDTRDSVFALFGYYMAENYHPLSVSELSMLNKLNFEYVITGSVEDTEKELKIKLFLIDIRSGKIDKKAEVEGGIKEDSIDKWEALIADLTRKLLNIQK